MPIPTSGTSSNHAPGWSAAGLAILLLLLTACGSGSAPTSARSAVAVSSTLPASASPSPTAKTAAEIVVATSDLSVEFKQLLENASPDPILPNPPPAQQFERVFARLPPAPGSVTIRARAYVYRTEADALEAFPRILKINIATYAPKSATEVALSESIGDESHVYQEAFNGSVAPQFLLWSRVGAVVTFVQTGTLAEVTRLGKLQVARARR